MSMRRTFPSLTSVHFVRAFLTAPKQFVGFLPDSVLSCGLGALLLQLPLVKAVGLGSQAESQFKSSVYCNLSSSGRDRIVV